MKQINELWPERFQEFIKEMQRYFKYMFNDHMKFVLIFGGGAAIYYYSQWVKSITEDFPVSLVMSIVLAFCLTISPIITLLKEADIVFLLPLENELTGYFKKGMKLSFVIQAYILLLTLAALMPLYFKATGAGLAAFIYLFTVLLVLKFWNLKLRWDTLKTNDSGTLAADQIIRFTLNTVILYFIIAKASWWYILAVVLIATAYTLYMRSIVKNKSLKWELLIEKEQGRMQMFYRTANMFTDVPHLKSKVWRRKWLDPLFEFISFGDRNTFRFLYSRTLVRTSEYSGLIIRLTLLACIILYFIDNLYVAVGVAFLFLYLTGFQLLPIYRLHDTKVWVHLYPVPPVYKKQDFYLLLTQVLMLQGLLFALFTLAGGNIVNSGLILLLSIMFAFGFGKQYAPGRIKKMEQYF
ncbi:ABC transporter permease [Siminovitchia acidinfaciens]|uniref:ABC transporter permease n=1 Tax=Siminovitchia acidinfaciens TaxID=2321395 RepID=A0A429Y1Q7_9BACI|nr:ABC transporter permease [Siminovitchia acidinfaciens]RST75173.1 ABC transporter permease [Siminovitchia acidinfaciens]